MTDADPEAPAEISRARRAWLDTQSALWRDRGLIDESTRAAILGRYTTESSEHRSLMALVLLAVLMCGIGLLLLIGYNWARIPAGVRVAMICAAVAAAFAGAAIAYGRGRTVAGDVIAFAGTFVFGNGIWLIADVLHIRGHFPDAFFWFAAGALAVALLLRSWLIGIGAAVLFGLWIFAEGVTSPRAAFVFLPIWLVLAAHAYRVSSPVMLRLVAILAPAWVFAATQEASDGPVWLGATTLAAAAVYAAGMWRRTPDRWNAAWQDSGLFVLLIMLAPLMQKDVHDHINADSASAASIAIAAAAGAAALSGVLAKTRDVKSVAVMCAAVITAAWTVMVGSGASAHGWLTSVLSTLLFSGAALGLAVALIRAALHSSRTADLIFGILFGLVFLFVRWMSVVENLLWSGLLLLAAGAGLFLVATLWRRRDRRPVALSAS